MMKRIVNFIMSVGVIAMIFGSVGAIAFPQPAYASNNCDGGFLGFPTWYRGITEGSDCDIKIPSVEDALSNFIWAIVLNVIAIGLTASGYVALGFILYGGLLFIIGQGEPEKMANARRTIINAVIGLVIALASVALVNFVAENIG